MKLVLREKSLREGELKSSNTLIIDAYNGIFSNLARGVPSAGATLSAPIKELIFEKSRPILIGAALYYQTGIDAMNLRNNKELLNAWIPEEKFFKQDYINNLLEKEFPIHMQYDVFFTKGGGVTGVVNTNSMYVPGVMINPTAGTQAQVKETIRHEVQHVTQFFNQLCMMHFKLLKAANYDFDKVQEPNFELSSLSSRLPKNIGIGKRPLHSPNQGTPPDHDPNLSDEENEERLFKWLERYFRDDMEFETWTTDLSVYIAKTALNESMISLQDLIYGYIVDKLPIFSRSKMLSEQENQIKKLRDISRAIGFSYPSLREKLKNVDGLTTLSQQIVHKFLTDEKLIALVAAKEKSKVLKQALKIFPMVRPKEFERDLAQRVEMRLRNYVENQYSILKTI